MPVVCIVAESVWPWQATHPVLFAIGFRLRLADQETAGLLGHEYRAEHGARGAAAERDHPAANFRTGI